MGLEINKPLGVGGINQKYYYQPKSASFGNNYVDTFESNLPQKYTSEIAIRKAIENNPKIKNITKDFNPELKLNMKELEEVLQNHSSDTQNIAKGIVQNLPFSLKNKVDIKSLDTAAYLHDIGKVIIPSEVLNKPGRLNDAETKIMHTHSELSYEILKNSGLDDKVLKLIRNHYQNAKRTGYPWVTQDFNADLNLQILSIADKYSALTEKRIYKDPLSPKEALTIISRDVEEGKLHPFVFKALVNFANTYQPIKV